MAALLAAVPGATVLPVLRRGNVRGAVTAGLTSGDGATGILQAAADGKIGCLVLLGSDPLSDVPDTDLARRALAGARSIVAVDTFLTASSHEAHVVLPAAAAGEKSGTTTNIEGRVSPVSQKVTTHGTSRPDWMIAVELGLELGHDIGFDSVESVAAALVESVPAFAPAADAAAVANDGVLLARGSGTVPTGTAPAAGERNSYDYRLVVSRKLYDAAVGTAMSPNLANLAPEAAVHLHPLDLDRLGAAAGSAVKVTSPTGSVVLPVQPDPASCAAPCGPGGTCPPPPSVNCST